MNAGVLITPRAVVRVPRLVFPSVDKTSNSIELLYYAIDCVTFNAAWWNRKSGMFPSFVKQVEFFRQRLYG
jgi:hypothetical protein